MPKLLILGNQPDALIRLRFQHKSVSLRQNASESYVDANDSTFHDDAQSHSTDQE